MTVRVLIVEDHPVHAEEMASLLERKGYAVCGVVSTGEEAERIALAQRPEVVITDLQLVGPKSGLDIAASLRRHYEFGLIFVTGFASSDLLRRRMRAHKPVAILAKPIDGHALLDAVLRAVKAKAPKP